MTFENANPTPPSDDTPVIDIGSADASGGLTFDPAKYGLEPDFGKEDVFQADEVIDNEEAEEIEEEQGSEQSDETQEEVDEPFILNDIDLSAIPKDLRRDTLEDTIKAINDAKTAKEQEAEQALNKLQEVTKEKSGSFVEKYQTQIKNLDAEIEFRFKEAKEHLQREVDSDRMTEAQANFEYGKYKEQVSTLREKHIADAYLHTNKAIVEDFIVNNKEALQNPVISEAAQIMLKDVLDDGNIVSTERSMNYLSLGKKLYDEGFKAGLSSVKKSAEQKQLADVKKRVSNPTTQKGGSSPKPRGIPYASPLDVPDKVWQENPEIRNYFLKKDLQDTFSLKS